MNIKIQILLALIVVIANAVLAGYYSGYADGYAQAQILKSRAIMIFFGDDSFLLRYHAYLAAFAGAYLTSKILSKSRVSDSMSVVGLLCAIFVYIRYTLLVVANSEISTVQNIANTASVLDALSVFLVAILLISEVWMALAKARVGR